MARPRAIPKGTRIRREWLTLFAVALSDSALGDEPGLVEEVAAEIERRDPSGLLPCLDDTVDGLSAVPSYWTTGRRVIHSTVSKRYAGK